MGKKAIILLAAGFEEIEAISVIDILRRANIDITIIGVSSKTIASARNVLITTDKTIDEINASAYDALILPGGSIGAKNLADSKKVLELVKNIFDSGKLLAAICASPAIVLAPIGILDNKTATCYPDMYDEFRKTTKFKNKKVVVDGNLITSQGPGTSIEFAFTIVEKLAGKDISNKIKKAMLVN